MERKIEVYSWRVSPTTKARLEEAARNQQTSVSQLLDEIVNGYLGAGDRDDGAEAERQRLLHLRAARFAGRMSGRDPQRSKQVRTLVRARLARRRGRAH